MNSKRFLLWLAFAISFLALLALPTAGAQAPRRTRVAVMDFDYAAVRSATSALFGTSVDVGRGTSDLLTTDLIKDGTFSVIDREAVERSMAEQEFSDSDRADPASAAKLGKLLHADAVIIGSITQFGGETENSNLVSANSESKAQVRIDARVINVETGQIQGVASGAGESSRSAASLLGGGGGWHGWGGANVDFASLDFQQTIIGEAIKTAVDQLSSNLVADASKVLRTAGKLEGVVAAVDSGQIILNVGSAAGVKVGDFLEVVRVTKEIKDPSTGEVIRRLTSSVGIIQATDVDEKSSVCTVVSGSDFLVGDRVRPVPPQAVPPTPPQGAPAAPASPATPGPASPASPEQSAPPPAPTS
jgi:curli biogenesis system outer membrane secretion channel CsgG